MAKRGKGTGVAESAVEASVAADQADGASEQARGSQVAAAGADLAGLAAREAVSGLGYPVAAEGRAVLERRERAAQAVRELEVVAAHCADARLAGAIVRALRAVVGAL